jgi:Tfp pilus assembly protein PilX
MMGKYLNQSGFTALVTLIIISSVALLISLSVNLISLSEMQMGFDRSRSLKAFWAAEACLDEAKIRLKRNSSYSGGSLTVDTNTDCTSSIVQNGQKIIITTTGTIDGIIIRRIESQVDLTGGRVTLDYWKELTN